MKTYGLILADNGTDMYVSGTYDTRWDNDVLNPSFARLTAGDFEVVQLGWTPSSSGTDPCATPLGSGCSRWWLPSSAHKQGAGGAFCSGADLSRRPDGPRPRHQWHNMRNVGSVALALARVPQPVIAKVGGVAVGAGCNLALGCDLVVASDEARFAEIFAKRGLSIDFGGSFLLPRIVGMHKAKELAFFADIISAKEAEGIGLVNRVVAAAQLDDVVEDWARRLAAGPPIALAQTKRLLTNSFEVTLEQALEDEGWAQTVNGATADTAEAMAAFLEKREPRFSGR